MPSKFWCERRLAVIIDGPEGRVQKAIECYSKAKAIVSPANKAEYSQVLMGLGEAHFDAGEFEETKTLYTEVLDYLDIPERARVEKLLKKIDTSLLSPRSGEIGSVGPDQRPAARHLNPIHVD